MTQNIFVTTVPLSEVERLKQGLIEQGFHLSTPPYTIFSGQKPGIVCTLYNSGKLVLQGNQIAPFIEFYLEPEILHALPFTYGHVPTADEEPLISHIGVDESGKGDFFGPLCVAAVFADADAISWLKKQGVRDSKQLNASFISSLAPKIAATLTHHIVTIGPTRYNELYEKFGNLNTLLAWGHATAIEQLVIKTGCRDVIIDKFAHEAVVILALKKKQVEVRLQQRHRAEEDPVVAAASLLARHAFVQELAALSRRCGISLPKGAASHVIAVGKELIRRYDKQTLGQVAKLHFKTAAAVMGQQLPTEF